MTRPGIPGALIGLALVLAGCGGGSSGATSPTPPPPPPPSIDKAEAFSFLNQATFGATEAEAQRVIEMGVEIGRAHV